MNTVQTTFHKRNPWTQEPLVKQVDPTKFKLCDDPMPNGRQVGAGKYEAIFNTLKPGKALQVPAEMTGKVTTALRQYIKVNKLLYVARSTKYYPGADVEMRGRVWLMASPKPALKRAA